MKRLPSFDLYQPESARDAASLLAEFDGEATLYAGGTELLLAMKEMVLTYEHLIDVKTIPELSGIQPRENCLVIGATTTHREVERSEVVRNQFPMLSNMARHVANPRVRAAGTIGGNLCFAEPHSDVATLLLTLDATCIVTDEARERRIPIDELIVGSYETSLATNEVMVAIEVPFNPGAIGGYSKFQVHERPMLGVAAMLELDAPRQQIMRARLSVGSVSPTPRRSQRAEELLIGPLGEVQTAIPKAASLLADDAELIDDEIGGSDYKRHLIGVLLGRVMGSALTAASGRTRQVPS